MRLMMRNITSARFVYGHRYPRFVAPVVAGILFILFIVAVIAAQAQSGRSQAGEPMAQVAWETYSARVLLKDREVLFSFAYPRGWYLVAEPEGYYFAVQNIPPFNDPSEVPGGLPEGFVKVGFMVDPKARAGDVFQQAGETISLNGLTWRQTLSRGGKDGDLTVTLETVLDGVVFRVYGYITRTGGKGPIFEQHLATLHEIFNRLQVQPIIQHETIPGAPPYPTGGKPKATPVGKPRVP